MYTACGRSEHAERRHHGPPRAARHDAGRLSRARLPRGRALIEFRLLGQVEAWRDGDRVELGGRKQKAVLAALLVRAGRVVALEQLIDDLWPTEPPARATATVQVFVSNLRRALEPDRPRGVPASLLATSAPGYVLRAEAGAIDAQEFTRLAEQARLALADDPERAAELLERAEALWRGPALADVRDGPFAQAEATRLEELRAACAEDRVDAGLALGRHAALVAELEQLVAAYPMRERPRAQLMLALYRSGRPADALEAYRAARRVLREELGLEPGTRLRALEQAVLRQDPGLAWEPPEPVMRPAAPGTAPAPGGTGRGRVLVVDDSGINRRLLVTALTELGHEVHAAEHGRRALELLRERDYDVVLLDLLMPVLDGYATLTEIKADPRLAHLPVIMVSAVHELESVVRCIELGATDYLPKPFSAAVLRARLRSSLAAKRLHDADRETLDRLREAAREVAEREAALRAELAALRAELARGGDR